MKPNIIKSVQSHLHFQKVPFFWRLTVLMLLTLGILIYSSALPNPFIWDDFELIIHNPLVRGWSHIPKLFAGNVVENSSFYRPLQMLSYVFDYEIWGINAKGFRLTNILLHVSVAVCLCWFLVVITRNRLTGLLAGLVFLVHPVHNEAVTYVSGRAEPLVAIFMLLTFILYLGYLEKGRLTDYLLCVGCFLLALLSKEYALILPALILAYHMVFNRRVNRELFFMLVALAVTYGALRLYNVIGVADMHEKTPTILLQRLPGSFYAQGMYLKLLIFPQNLFLGYGQKLYSWSNPLVWGG
ncbi:MAG: glycosyltransferase family 39 protein, partial [Candidatus Omnitrophica bacterium]|nr:glycosyltransferase family 39 protein [Candidatus Omnitrophota bacterium]